MKYGLHNELASDFEDIGDRILKWGYERINYALKLNRTFLRIPILLFLVAAPLSQSSVNVQSSTCAKSIKVVQTEHEHPKALPPP